MLLPGETVKLGVASAGSGIEVDVTGNAQAASRKRTISKPASLIHMIPFLLGDLSKLYPTLNQIYGCNMPFNQKPDADHEFEGHVREVQEKWNFDTHRESQAGTTLAW
jgi:hypothetical protein